MKYKKVLLIEEYGERREWGVQAGQLALVDRAAGEATGERSGDATAPSLEKSDAQAMVSVAR